MHAFWRRNHIKNQEEGEAEAAWEINEVVARLIVKFCSIL